MKRIRYTTPAGSQGKPFAQRAAARIVFQNTPPLASIAKGDEVGPVHVGVRAALPLRRLEMERGADGMTPFDRAFPATSPGRAMEPAVMEEDGTVRSGPSTLYSSDHSPYAHSICVQPHAEKRAPFTVGIVRIRADPRKATLELCDRRSNPSMGIDAVVHEDAPPDCVCDSGYGVTPGTVMDEDTAASIPDCIVLWPGRPTTSTIATSVEDYAWFEAFADDDCATGIACTPAPHMQNTRKGRRG